MYQFDSGSQWFSMPAASATPASLTDSKVAMLPLQQEVTNSELEEQRLNAVERTPNYSDFGSEKKASETQLEQLISNLLKYGVLIASAVVFVGGFLYLLHRGAEPAEYGFFQGAASQFRSPVGVVKAVLAGSDRGIIQLGLLILIATPIVRVTISLVTFLKQRDFTYAIMTFLVLAALIFSLIGAYW